MRVAIATTGRFHVLDLARELSALGHDVMFYTFVPKRRVLRFGLPSQCYRGYFLWIFPLLVAQRYGGRFVKQFVDPWILRFADWIIAQRLEPCDVFIGMSGVCVKSAIIARERYGAKVWIERGSRHILSQKEILDQVREIIPATDAVPDYAVTRHIESTKVADIVVLPSQHAAESFVERGFPRERLFLNPYGVQLDQFPPTPSPKQSIPTVLYVGAWSYQKGCDLLSAAVQRFEGRVRLLHVGVLADATVPAGPWFQHIEPVPQWQLKDIYSQAHIFALASRQEGLALVQAQALACGLPVVSTDRSGGADLAELTGLQEAILVIPHDNIDALTEAIERALSWASDHCTANKIRDLLGTHRDQLSWQAYALRYSKRLHESMKYANKIDQ